MKKLIGLIVFLVGFVPTVYAEATMIWDTKLVEVIVNGASDTTNPGTSCVTTSATLSAKCTSGVVAIQNNNKQLLASALQAKALNSSVTFYYDTVGNFHCPGRVFTPCSVNSIGIK